MDVILDAANLNGYKFVRSRYTADTRPNAVFDLLSDPFVTAFCAENDG